MILISVIIYWVVLGVSAFKIPIPGENHSSIVKIDEIAVEILSQCYLDDYKEIIIHGTSDAATIKIFQTKLAVIKFDRKTFINNDKRLRLYKNIFILTPQSISQLRKNIETLKNVIRWDIMAPFFILDRSKTECNNAREMLRAAWEWNLVETFFLCVNSKRVLMIYTYNPYTNRAPQQWKQIRQSTKQLNGWTMFVRHHQIRNICRGMIFDRLKQLDGSVIKLAVKTTNDQQCLNCSKDILPKLYGDIKITIMMMEYFFNATIVINAGSIKDVFRYIENGSSDVALLLIGSNPNMSYPVIYAPLHIVTNNRSLYTPLEKIGNYYGIVTLVSLLVILLIVYIVIVLSENTRRWSFAGFEILRLLINAALHTRIDTIALRIFFFTIFWYFLILHATFQGHLVSFLMKDEYRFTAESLNDLKSSKYDEIYIKSTLEPQITDPILRKKLKFVEESCIFVILGRDKAACISEQKWFVFNEYRYKLIVSKQPVFIHPNSYAIYKDWPLRDRFNSLLMWLESSGQSTGDYQRKLFEFTKKILRRKAAKLVKSDIRPIAMSMLDWIFIFLLIGLIVAVISLIVERKVEEYATMRKDKRQAARRIVKKHRRKLLNRVAIKQQMVEKSRLRFMK